MKRKQLLTTIVIVSLLLLAALYQLTRSNPVEAFQVARESIQQYVDDTGTVKSEQSQTVYLENTGRITSLYADVGDRVRRGDLLLKMSPADLKIAELASVQAKINLESAQKDWEKAQTLFQDGAISKTDFDNAETTYRQAVAVLQSANAEFGKQQKNLIVQAPLDGIVLQKAVDVNQVVTPGTAAFIIGSPHNLEVDVDILADDVVKIRPGNTVAISGQATGSAVLQGKVTKVAPMAQNIVSSLGVNQKRATITIDFTGGTGLLKPGYDVDVRVFTQTKAKAITVPASAVFDLQGKNYVFVIVKSRTQLRTIEKGIENDDQIEVISGLKPGEWVLSKPDNSIKEGMKVKVTNG